MLDQALDRAVLARGVAAFEEDDGALAGPGGGELGLDQGLLKRVGFLAHGGSFYPADRPEPVEGRVTSGIVRGPCFDKLSTNGSGYVPRLRSGRTEGGSVLGPVRRAEHRADAGGGDVGVDADAEHRAAVGGAAFDIGGGLRVGAVADRVLAIVDDVERGAGRVRRARRSRRRSGRCRARRSSAPRRRPRRGRRTARSPAVPLSS